MWSFPFFILRGCPEQKFPRPLKSEPPLPQTWVLLGDQSGMVGGGKVSWGWEGQPLAGSGEEDLRACSEVRIGRTERCYVFQINGLARPRMG